MTPLCPPCPPRLPLKRLSKYIISVAQVVLREGKLSYQDRLETSTSSGTPKNKVQIDKNSLLVSVLFSARASYEPPKSEVKFRTQSPTSTVSRASKAPYEGTIQKFSEHEIISDSHAVFFCTWPSATSEQLDFRNWRWRFQLHQFKRLKLMMISPRTGYLGI